MDNNGMDFSKFSSARAARDYRESVKNLFFHANFPFGFFALRARVLLRSTGFEENYTQDITTHESSFPEDFVLVFVSSLKLMHSKMLLVKVAVNFGITKNSYANCW